MTGLNLPGLDAQNPLGFFAALGLLRIVDDHSVRQGKARPTLSFPGEANPVAHLESFLDFEGLVGLILEDAAAQSAAPFLQLAYTEAGVQVAPDAAEAKHDLKPPPALARRFLKAAAASSRRDSDLAAGLFSELVTDNNGNTKPTAFHFTAGNQVFLAMVEELRKGIVAADIGEALLGPWIGASLLPSLSWDSSVSRQYALRASNPSKDKKTTVAAANWLGVNALGFFPVNVIRSRLMTAGVVGGWKDSVFSWPVWSVPLAARSVASLLRTNARNWSAREREAMGINRVFSAQILRSDQGGYGSFTPAEVVLPR
jgi:hypothetical protein